MTDKLVQFGDQVIAFPSDMSDSDIAAVLSQQTQQTAPQQQESGLGRSVGIAARGAVQGTLGNVTVPLEAAQAAQQAAPKAFLLSPALSALGTAATKLVGGQAKPYGQQVSESLTQLGLPQPETTGEKAMMGSVEALAGGAYSLPTSPLEKARALAALAVGGASAQPVAQEVSTRTGSELLGQAAGVGASMVAGGATGKGIKGIASAWDEKLPSIQEVKTRAQQNYSVLDEQGVSIKPKSVLDMVGTLRQNLDKSNWVPTNESKVVNVLKQFEDIVGTERVPFTKLENMRSMAVNLAQTPGQDNANTRRLGGILVSGIDDYINSLNGKDIIAGKEGLDKSVKAVTSARQDWRNASKAQVIQDALDIADIKGQLPQKSESELIRNNLANILANKNKRNLFTEAEVNEMKSVINGGPVDVIASLIGRFNPLRPFGGAYSGSVALGTSEPMAGAALAGAGLLTDVTQSALKRRAMDNLIRSIASGRVSPQENMKYRGALGGILGEQQ